MSTKQTQTNKKIPPQCKTQLRHLEYYNPFLEICYLLPFNLQANPALNFQEKSTNFMKSRQIDFYPEIDITKAIDTE